MDWFKNTSIRKKLIAALTGVCVLTLILCFGGIAAFEYQSFRGRSVSNLESQADMLVVLLGTTLEFMDIQRAEELLAKLKAVPHIESAVLLDSQGQTFATYQRVSESVFGAAAKVDGVSFVENGAVFTRSLTQEGEFTGRLILRSNNSVLKRRFKQQLTVLGGLLIALSGVAGLLAWVLQRAVTKPLVNLAEIAVKITKDKNFEGRAEVMSRDEVGQLTETVNTMLDGLQERERALRASEERFRAFMENNPAVAFLKDQQSNYLYGNRSFCRKIGGSPEELPGRSDKEIWPVDMASKLADCEARVEAGKPSISVEEIVFPDGKREWWTLIHFLVEEHSGERLVGGIGVDITSLKEAEQIRQLNEELERRVASRTVQLEKKNQELESFSYSVSHDLRAPLRNLGGFVELLTGEMKEIDGDVKRYMGIIRDEARRMGQLIDDLLLFSRLGRAEMSVGDVDLNALVREAREGMRTDLVDRNVEWKIAELPVVPGDHNLLRQIYANLIGNAVKFTKNRDPAVIEIGATPVDAHGRITLYVTDNGAGFNNKYLDKLFGVFQRLHSAKQFEGTGIGLANVRTIVERHGGRVWASGEVDQGATFSFSLPAKKSGAGETSA
jgi:PAS domain S-box-containing protein